MDQQDHVKLEITVFTTDPCARCVRAKEVLRRHELEFEEVNLVKDPVGRRKLAEFTGHMTFPQIVIDGRPLGGLQELIEADADGTLRELAAAQVER
jgi:glutaredoxin 3